MRSSSPCKYFPFVELYKYFRQFSSPLYSGGKGSWSTWGCWSEGYDAKTETYRCRSNHLTHFAILLDVTDTKHTDPDGELALLLITYIGCGISLAGLITTFVTFAIFRLVTDDKANLFPILS